MIVGEAPGSDEVRLGRPFVGAAGMELDRMLMEVGLSRGECFVTNVCREQPRGNDIGDFIPRRKKDITPECVLLRDRLVKPVVRDGYGRLMKEIALVKPNVIIAMGNTALWALTGHWGIGDWRGSELSQSPESLAVWFEEPGPKVVPTYHPAAILRQWEWRAAALHDLRRALQNADSRTYPPVDWTFIVRPSFAQAVGTLNALLRRLSSGPVTIAFDIETRAGHIACAGVAWSASAALCVPLMAEWRDGYWPEHEEEEIIWLLRNVLCHPNAAVVGQNLLYDCQYTQRHWCFTPRVAFDTMIAFHTAFPALPKALDFQASVLCARYVFWKNESKIARLVGDEVREWRYNCEDCVRTFEIAEALGVGAV